MMLDQISQNTPKGSSSSRFSTKPNPKKLPTVLHNKRFFPSDFFDASPKYEQSRAHSGVTRSAARKEVSSLQRENIASNYGDHSNLDINPFKIQAKRDSINCRSLPKTKIRPQSYRVSKRHNLQCYEDNIDSSFISNISIVNQNGVDDSFTSLRNESNSSKLSRKAINPRVQLPYSSNKEIISNLKNFKFKKGLKLKKLRL